MLIYGEQVNCISYLFCFSFFPFLCSGLIPLFMCSLFLGSVTLIIVVCFNFFASLGNRPPVFSNLFHLLGYLCHWTPCS
ncbi:Uncharacterised protein [Campylobacter jejuni]|nr:Uncharacterised protein [Campylobacter jejuni]